MDRETLKVAVEVFEAQQESEEELGQAVGVSGKELREMKEQVKDPDILGVFSLGKCFFVWGDNGCGVIVVGVLRLGISLICLFGEVWDELCRIKLCRRWWMIPYIQYYRLSWKG